MTHIHHGQTPPTTSKPSNVRPLVTGEPRVRLIGIESFQQSRVQKDLFPAWQDAQNFRPWSRAAHPQPCWRLGPDTSLAGGHPVPHGPPGNLPSIIHNQELFQSFWLWPDTIKHSSTRLPALLLSLRTAFSLPLTSPSSLAAGREPSRPLRDAGFYSGLYISLCESG